MTSRFDPFVMEGAEVTASLYACPNIRTEERAVRVDRNTPGPMRAPPEVPFLFALESAVDEMAAALDMDPIALRRLNDAAVDPVSGKPFSTRPLMACFEAGARAFGWSRRVPRPGSMRDGPWRVGLGCATSVRPAKIAAATMRVRLGPDGSAEVSCAHHEIGTGITTLLAHWARRTGSAWRSSGSTVRLGDTDLPAAGISGGSSTTTSLMGALALGCAQLRETLAQAATGQGGRLAGRDPVLVAPRWGGRLAAPDGTGIALAEAVGTEGVGDGRGVCARGQRPGDGARRACGGGHIGLSLGGAGKAVSWGFGAQFAEVHVHAETGEIRVARLTGAFAAGRILNPLTARSQLMGGMIWGLGSALLEETVRRRRRLPQPGPRRVPRPDGGRRAGGRGAAGARSRRSGRRAGPEGPGRARDHRRERRHRQRRPPRHRPPHPEPADPAGGRGVRESDSRGADLQIAPSS
ncbi:xanthine dehydrogenase family protein molybdopterin-binding subunit [Methylobacterium oryzae CBMB20]